MHQRVANLPPLCVVYPYKAITPLIIIYVCKTQVFLTQLAPNNLGKVKLHLRRFENCVNFRILIESCVVQRENLKWLSFLLYVVLHNRAAAWEALSSRQT